VLVDITNFGEKLFPDVGCIGARGRATIPESSVLSLFLPFLYMLVSTGSSLMTPPSPFPEKQELALLS
jgi:hypothetical protein